MEDADTGVEGTHGAPGPVQAPEYSGNDQRLQGTLPPFSTGARKAIARKFVTRLAGGFATTIGIPIGVSNRHSPLSGALVLDLCFMGFFAFGAVFFFWMNVRDGTIKKFPLRVEHWPIFVVPTAASLVAVWAAWITGR